MAIVLHETTVGSLGRKCCKLLKPVPDHDGRTRFREAGRILSELDNLGRQLLLVQFADGVSAVLFPDEVATYDC